MKALYNFIMYLLDKCIPKNVDDNDSNENTELLENNVNVPEIYDIQRVSYNDVLVNGKGNGRFYIINTSSSHSLIHEKIKKLVSNCNIDIMITVLGILFIYIVVIILCLFLVLYI